MGKIAFLLGVVATVVVGVVLSGRLHRRDYSASVVGVRSDHPCPTLGVNFDKEPDLLPDELVRCSCPTPAEKTAGSTPIHPPADLVSAAAPLDLVTISYTEFTPPFGGTKRTGLSFVLWKGPDKQSFTVSSAWAAYSPFALLTAAPFLAGLVLSFVLSMIPRKAGPGD